MNQENRNKIDEYLDDYLSGNIKQGLKIDCDELDYHIRFKSGQLVIVNGLDNVGKTIWMLWYFLVLSLKHDLKFCIYSGENKPEMLVRMLIQFYLGKKLTEVSRDKVYNAQTFVLAHFDFIDYKGFYTVEDLLDKFSKSKADGYLIDPYTALNRGYTHADNYDFLNKVRNYVNTSNSTIYVNTHVVSEAARQVHTANDGKGVAEAGLIGYHKPPSKSQSEGGQPFANRVDDFITIHRYLGHDALKFKTLIYIRKVKDTDTGGEVSPIDRPIYFDWNYGCGFICNGVNPITGERTEQTPF